MKRCLNDKELVAAHAGDGPDEVRLHLESCLSCTRRYRALQGDLETLIAALRQAPPLMLRPRGLVAAIPWSRGLGWSLAASVIVGAFVCGRMTGISTPSVVVRPTVVNVPVSAPASEAQVAMVEDSNAPAAYGLYLDDLMGSDASTQSQTAADGQDTGDQADGDGF